MSEGLNRVMLLGNLGADPELKFTQNGQAVLKMRLATSEQYKTQSGEWEERTEWHSITVWGKRAEGLGKFLTKGARLFVEGSLRTSSWEDKQGQKRYRTEVNARNVILGGRSDGQSQNRSGGGSGSGAAPQSGGGGYDDADYGVKDDPTDLPF